MKFSIRYSPRAFGKSESGRQAMARFLSENPEKSAVQVQASAPPKESTPMAPYFNAGLGRPYDDGA